MMLVLEQVYKLLMASTTHLLRIVLIRGDKIRKIERTFEKFVLYMLFSPVPPPLLKLQAIQMYIPITLVLADFGSVALMPRSNNPSVAERKLSAIAGSCH